MADNFLDTATTPAAVALGWVQGRAGAASTIIGGTAARPARPNLAALDVRLADEHVTALDRASEPTLNFPANFPKFAVIFMHGGATVNGGPSAAWRSRGNGAERY